MPATTLTLLGRPGCHLCDDAHAVIAEVLVDFPSVALLERSILDDAELHERYRDEIPVVLIDDAVHAIWRVDPTRLRSALEEASA